MKRRITIPGANWPAESRVTALVVSTVEHQKRGQCIEVEVREGDTDWMAVLIDAGWARRLHDFLGDWLGGRCDHCHEAREHHLHRPSERCPGCQAPQDHHDYR